MNRPPAPPPVVSGTVFTAGEPQRPLGGATVRLRAPLSPAERARAVAAGRALEPAVSMITDEEGRFRLRAPSYGLWRLELRAPDHGPREVELYPLLHDRELLPVALTRTAQVLLRVVNESGQPIEGARLDALPHADRGLPRGPATVQAARERARSLVVTALSSHRGEAELEVPPAQPFRVHVQAEGYAPITRSDLRHAQAPIVLTLRRVAPRQVCVRTPQDEPASDAVVSVSPLVAATTDERGCTALSLPQGAQLVAYTQGGARAAQLVRSERGVITLQAQPPAQLRGLVLRRPAADRRDTPRAPEPLPAATVWSEPGVVVGANAAGEFTLLLHPPLRPDVPSSLSAAARGARTETRDFDLASLDRGLQPGLLAPLVLEPTTTLHGTVQTDDFEPISSATVWLREVRRNEPNRPRAGSGPIRTARTDAAGRFVVEGISTTVGFELVGAAPGFAVGSVAVAERGALDPLDQRPVLRLAADPSLTSEE